MVRAQASPFPTAERLRLPASLSRPRARVAPAKSEPLSRLGEQIKALRIAAGKTGGELAAQCGVSSSLLSRVERGLVSPSVETLSRIAEGLDVSLSRFFSDQRSRSDLSLVRAGHGIVVDRIGAVENYRYELLGHLLSGNMFVEPYLVRLLPDAKPYAGFQHPGMKFLHLTSGRVRYRYGTKAMDLKPGDSLLFEASALHGIEEVQEVPVSYLVIVYTMRE
ncbi:helix-turn-helix transcriptional regulator [Variovorax paradoxus]|nr:helix-turn-helix transcriptional regulator [Variovorax paradoxus]